jgi:hypothetical protein
MEINNEGDLYAKLPLGASVLGGRVQSGEKFRMEYFVSGTRTATRDSVYKDDLARLPRCKGATHFVYGYNLGAFALGAQSNIQGTAGGSAFGFGAGGSRSSSSKADKQGGQLASCRGESAKEVETCKVPIRLTLREISGGASADASDARAPETEGAANLAGRLKATTDREREAQDHTDTARLKMSARDGKGCLAELDVHDKLDPRPGGLSTNAAASFASLRSQCLMLAGQCGAGKVLYRQALEKSAGATLGPDQMDKKTDAAASTLCQGASMSDRDQFASAVQSLHQGAWEQKKAADECAAAYATYKRLLPSVKPRDDDDDQVKFGPANVRTDAPMCLAKAGDCAQAWTVYKEAWKLDPSLSPASRNLNEEGLRVGFEAVVARCKGK